MSDQPTVTTPQPAAPAERPSGPSQGRPQRPSRPPFRGGPGGGPGGEGGGRRPFSKKVCRYCKNKDLRIDYKDARALRSFISERGKILPRRMSGNCAKHQREIGQAIKRARAIAIIPYTAISLDRG
ncbi:MAG: 30S ribosomal protein S18 [Deltaproteobacteria bacterium]|nr:30S ribosomal protein S18 [Deltaproteobacteria bacterium]